jgi:hypothetical protein
VRSCLPGTLRAPGLTGVGEKWWTFQHCGAWSYYQHGVEISTKVETGFLHRPPRQICDAHWRGPSLGPCHCLFCPGIFRTVCYLPLLVILVHGRFPERSLMGYSLPVTCLYSTKERFQLPSELRCEFLKVSFVQITLCQNV